MGGQLRSAALAAVLLLAGACEGSGVEEETPPARFGTADASLLVLAESDAPRGMSLRLDISGPQTLYQYTGDPERVDALRALGSDGGYLQQFDAETTALGQAKPVKPLSAATLYSEVLIFEDNEGAAEALEYLRDTPNPALEDVDFASVSGFGDNAFLQASTSGGLRNAGVYWRTGNALVSVIAQGAGSKPATNEVEEIASEVAQTVAAAEATGEDLELPAAPEVGDAIFEDDLDGSGEWDLVLEGDPTGARLSRHVEGALQVGIDGPGGRWHDTSELPNRTLRQIGDQIVEAEVVPHEGEATRWGLMCDVIEDAGFYLFVVGSDGFAGVFVTASPTQPLDPLAVVPESEVLREAVAGGRHHLRADCAGDPIARLALYVNDELLLEAYDDDPLPGGAAGMWVESQQGPAYVLFDNFVISAPAED